MGARTVTVLGATGKTGRAVVSAALGKGMHVRAVSRDPARGAPRGTGHDATPGRGTLSWHRADAVTGDGLAAALAGADAAYLVVPNVHPDEVGAVARAARAATDARVERLVYHSVADPDDARMPHHLRKAEAERVLHEVRPDTVVLRPCAYQQNLLPAALAGSMEVPYRLDVPFSLVDLGDVAQVAAAALEGRVGPGGAHVLAGPEQLTVADLARTATRILGRQVTATATTVERWRAGPGAGITGSALEDLLAMFAAYDQSGFAADPAPLASLLGRRPTGWAELLTKESA